MTDKYTMGNCSECGKFTALLNGKCRKCEDKKPDITIPDFLQDLVDGKLFKKEF